jgi:hypothetical protein
VQRDLARYYDTLALALGSVTLSSNEAGALVDLLNGTLISLPTAQLLAAELEDGLADGLARCTGGSSATARDLAVTVSGATFAGSRPPRSLAGWQLAPSAPRR